MLAVPRAARAVRPTTGVVARPRDPVVSAVLDAALHALTHTEVAARDQVRLQRELVAE